MVISGEKPGKLRPILLPVVRLKSGGHDSIMRYTPKSRITRMDSIQSTKVAGYSAEKGTWYPAQITRCASNDIHLITLSKLVIYNF